MERCPDVLMADRVGHCQGWGQHPHGHELDSARTTVGVKLDEGRLNGPGPLPSAGLLLQEHVTPGGDSVCGPRARRGSEEATSPLLTDLLRGWQTAAQGGFGHTAWTLSKTSFSWCHVHAARHVWECVGASDMALMSPGGTGPSDWNLPRVWLCPGHEVGALRWGPPVPSDSRCLKQGHASTLHFWLHGAWDPGISTQPGNEMFLE